MVVQRGKKRAVSILDIPATAQSLTISGDLVSRALGAVEYRQLDLVQGV